MNPEETKVIGNEQLSASQGHANRLNDGYSAKAISKQRQLVTWTSSYI